MDSSGTSRRVRFSLRGLLVTIAFFAVACAALKFANNGWWLAVSSAALLLVMAMTIVAIVDRGAPRAFASGFIACVVIYGLLTYVDGERKYGAGAHQQPLPTTRQLIWLYGAVKAERYIDDKTRETLSGFVPPNDGSVVVLADNMGYYGDYAPTFNGQPSRVVHLVVRPDLRTYMSIGHVLWGMVLGLVGGQFALFVYARSEKHMGGPDSPLSGLRNNKRL